MIIFQSFLLISLQHVMGQDTNQQTGCPGLINGTVGQNVTLKCKLEKFLLKKLMVSWTLKNQSIQVHMYRNGGDDTDSQHPNYINRTSVFPDQFKHGNISLELANVTKKDEGTYTWAVHYKSNFNKTGNITLHVVENGSQGNRTPGDENRRQNNWTAGENNRAVFITIVFPILLILVIAVVISIMRDKICDGKGGDAEGNDALMNADVILNKSLCVSSKTINRLNWLKHDP